MSEEERAMVIEAIKAAWDDAPDVDELTVALDSEFMLNDAAARAIDTLLALTDEHGSRLVLLASELEQIGYRDADDRTRPPYIMPNKIVPHWVPVYRIPSREGTP